MKMQQNEPGLHFAERREDDGDARILPLINIVFLLLIFFMVAGTLATTEPYDIEPPVSSTKTEADTDAIEILLDGQSRFAMDQDPFSEDDIIARITERVGQDPGVIVQLKVDANLPANRMVAFTHRLYDAGLKKLRILTLAKD